MPLAHQKGDMVRLRVHVPVGTVEKVEVVDGDKIHYHVRYKDKDGEEHVRAFHEAQLEAVPDVDLGE